MIIFPSMMVMMIRCVNLNTFYNFFSEIEDNKIPLSICNLFKNQNQNHFWTLKRITFLSGLEA